jgi:RNA polymerase subunit RPABC4/transcription elongation factor Spt4
VSSPGWICTRCKAEVDAGFEVCWQCGASHEGEIDPEFRREIDVATLPEGVPLIECRGCGYQGKSLVGHRHLPWWRAPLGMAFSTVFVGFVPWTLFYDIITTLKKRVCPRCREDALVIEWHGEPTPEADETWRVADEADEIAFHRSRMLLYAILLSLIAVGVGYYFYSQPRL